MALASSFLTRFEFTLPPSDKFWNEYYPPNGWRCRCTAVQVRRGKYPESDSDEAVKAGEKATTQIGKDGTDKGKIFRFNPGKQEKIFPPKHPYLPKGCGNCEYKRLVFDNEKAICKACIKVDAASVKWSRERVREHYQKQFNGEEVCWEINNSVVDKLTLSYQDIKTITGKAHDYPYARNMSVYYLKELMKQATYLGNSPDIKGTKVHGHGDVLKWHYFKIPFMKQESFIVIKETKDGAKIPHHIQDKNHFDYSKIKNKAE